ncbi:MAG: RDD family protein [Epsilonproteobacteria bacterium]|nr:RDD family protein [Campylobacterota bacterium]
MEEKNLTHYNIAPISARVWAMLIDDLFVSLLFFAIFFEQIMAFSNASDLEKLALFLNNNFLVLIILKITYQTLFVWQNGATAGKIAMKIKVIDMNSGEKPNFTQSSLRASGRIISETIFYIGYLIAYFNPLTQTLHDKMAKSIVVNA